MERRINKSVFVIPVVYIILGLVMVIFPQTTMKTFCLSLGAIAAVLGIVSLISYFSRDAVDFVYRYDFVNGVLLILLGLLFIVKMELITELIPVMLGVMVLANGIMKLQHTIDLKRIGFNGWLYVLVFSLLSLLVGAVCILQPDFIASILVILMGISFLFCGLTDFITLFFLSRRLKEFVNGAVKDTVDVTVDVTDESYESFSTSSETTYNKPVSESAENKKIDFKSIFKRKKEDTNEIPAEENKEADNISEEINSTDNPSGPDTEEKEDYPVYSGYTSGDVSSEAVDSESETGEVYEEEKSEKAETEAEETKDAMDDQVNDGEDSSEEGEQTDKESGSYNTII